MKQLLLRTPLGRLAMDVRSTLELAGAAIRHTEQLGSLSNDALAEKLVTSLCKEGSTFIDVGAHIGSIIYAVNRKTPSAKIIAIEAIPEKADKLRKLFPNTEIHCCAVGESSGEVSFYINLKESGYSSLGKSVHDNQNIREITVPLKLLDDIINAQDADVMKIDVEGAELGVLRGAKNLLSSCRPLVMFESGPGNNEHLGYTKEGMFNFLGSMEYSILVPNRLAHHDDGLDLSCFLDSHVYPRRTTNYFAVPRERRDEFRTKARQVLGLQK